MKSVSGKAFAKLIEKRGWHPVRINGSHHVYMKIGNLSRISIPVHGNEASNKPKIIRLYFVREEIMSASGAMH